ncbi:hypothetical protein OBBRIDRAFT_865879, partial [Obba rivulosa]
LGTRRTICLVHWGSARCKSKDGSWHFVAIGCRGLCHKNAVSEVDLYKSVLNWLGSLFLSSSLSIVTLLNPPLLSRLRSLVPRSLVRIIHTMEQPNHIHPLLVPWDDEVDIMPSLSPNPVGEQALRRAYEDLNFRVLLARLADEMQPSRAPHPIPPPADIDEESVRVGTTDIWNTAPRGQHYAGAEHHTTINVPAYGPGESLQVHRSQ